MQWQLIPHIQYNHHFTSSILRALESILQACNEPRNYHRLLLIIVLLTSIIWMKVNRCISDDYGWKVDSIGNVGFKSRILLKVILNKLCNTLNIHTFLCFDSNPSYHRDSKCTDLVLILFQRASATFSYSWNALRKKRRKKH